MSDRLQLHCSLVLGAGVVCYLFGGISWHSLVAFLFLWGALEYAVNGAIKGRLRTLRQEGERFERSIISLGLAEANSRATEALRASQGCSTLEIDPSIPAPDGLPEGLFRVFSRYQRVSFPSGDVLELGDRNGDYIQVGSTFDGAPILARLKDASIFEWDSGGIPPLDQMPDYPSLSHWIVKAIEE